MSEPWSAERVVDADLARSLVESQFPDLAPAHVEPFGLGWDNTAYLLNEAFVFRFPRRAIAVPLLERELALLPTLAPRLPLPIPLPQFSGQPSERFPWPFAGYRRLAGCTVCRAALSDAARSALAVPLAQFLAALHAFPIEKAVAHGAVGDELGRLDIATRMPLARATLAELALLGLLDAEALRHLGTVLDATPIDAGRPAPVLVHGDLYARHILVDDQGNATGVIDWGDIHLGDCAVDLAVAHSFLPCGAQDAFRQAYGAIEKTTWQLACFRALYHSANVTRYAHRIRDMDLLGEGVRALRALGERVALPQV